MHILYSFISPVIWNWSINVREVDWEVHSGMMVKSVSGLHRCLHKYSDLKATGVLFCVVHSFTRNIHNDTPPLNGTKEDIKETRWNKLFKKEKNKKRNLQHARLTNVIYYWNENTIVFGWWTLITAEHQQLHHYIFITFVDKSRRVICDEECYE